MAIANLRTFNQEQLLHVLIQCAHHLTYAWEQTEIDSLYDVSFEASMACEYLRCELAAHNSNYRVH